MAEQEIEIQKLIEGCLAADRKAQHLLYRQLYAFAARIAMRYARDEADVADILSHAFVKVFRSIKNFDSSKGNFHGWVKRIVINEGLDHIKSINQFENVALETITDPAVENKKKRRARAKARTRGGSGPTASPPARSSCCVPRRATGC